MRRAHASDFWHKVAVSIAVVLTVSGGIACDSGGLGQCAQCQGDSECKKGLSCVFHDTNCRALPANLLICDKIGYCEPTPTPGTVAPDPDPCPAPR